VVASLLGGFSLSAVGARSAEIVGRQVGN